MSPGVSNFPLRGESSPLQKAINLVYLIEKHIIQKSQPFGGDPDSTGGMRQRLHARDAVGPLKNGIHIIANDYEVAVAA